MQPETDYAPDTGDRIDHSTEPGSAAGSVPGVQCSVCSSTFRRPEHLKRHLRSHTKEKPFECPQCGRHFSRTDTLHRHELSHHTQGSDGGKDRTHRITVKTFRACFGCAMARVRCSGGHPCGRCDTRSLECQYPTERRSKAKARNGSSRRLSITEDNELLPYEPHPDPALMEGTMSFQLTQTPAHNTKDSQTTSVSNPQHCLLSSEQGSTIPPIPIPSAVYQKDDCSQSYKGVIDPGRTSMYTTEPATGMSSHTKKSQADVLGTRGSRVNADVDMSGNSNMELEFDRSFFEPSMSSTMNWLPSEIFAPGDQAQRLGPPSQQPEPFISEAYAAHMASQLPVINMRQTNFSLPANVSQIPSKKVTLEANTDTPIGNPHVVSETSLNTDSVDSEKLSANYYLDGGGARLPKYGKNQGFRTSSPSETPRSEKSLPDTSPRSFGFPTPCEIRADKVSTVILQSLKPIEASRYDEIHAKFLLLCRQENPFFEVFDSAHFPAADECNGYILCFFDSFNQTTYPMLHISTFDPNQCHWLLALAVIAIGCHFSGTMEIDRCTTAFHEMIRRALLAEKKNGDCFEKHTLDLVQAMLLNCIGNLHSRYEDDQRFAMSSFSDLVTLSNNEGLLASHSKNPIAELSGSSSGVQWSQWVESEVRKRTGYCIWLLDSTFAYYFEQRPLLSLDDGQAALPSHERLWQVNSAEAWKQEWVDSTVNESLYDAVHMLYIEKKLASGIGEFSHILLIHALYHRMWEVGDYFRRPLSFWSPTTKRQSCKTAIPTGSVWLPGIPSYSKWRNSACDCLDILHWTANSTIANAAGLEHPTVLHLHTARLILLAPFREIRSLATSLATGKVEWDQRSQELEWQYIWRWVKHDQYKARLSIIHAGVTLWHIRRYSTNAFHEPTAAFLAVLTLWAYGTCHVNGSQNSSPESETNRSDISNKPSFVHLDRPCDDELVQLFVREGYAMKGNVTGVGDICASDGPERILRMGCETLSCLKAWGISKRLIFILKQLADIMSRGHDTTSDIC